MSDNSETTETMPAVAETIETAASKIEKLKGDLKDQADKAIGKAKETASAAYDKAAAKARELADAAPEKAREVKERAQKVAEEGTAKVRTTVQEQPLAALGAGIALGFVVGWLLSGRKKD
ncbi:DUF883 family protein [Sandarakinorhabdus limnophila]|jgi:ElaB/YqjD/DUF883 family membrane-anchored ribosome-binding protein|uniref:DUF883 family protein n=1 Tax=Sandarakinorhabdus limnophila TaxID=210512 RepID=UPI0003B5B10B|nr:DUF883 family protein [Sandarakinorhabdus limnophila]MCM0033552.1 DUF883 family protein [Sandarakinorhabdus limnophila]